MRADDTATGKVSDIISLFGRTFGILFNVSGRLPATMILEIFRSERWKLGATCRATRAYCIASLTAAPSSPRMSSTISSSDAHVRALRHGQRRQVDARGEGLLTADDEWQQIPVQWRPSYESGSRSTSSLVALGFSTCQETMSLRSPVLRKWIAIIFSSSKLMM
jgi:hypothetical protein